MRRVVLHDALSIGSVWVAQRVETVVGFIVVERGFFGHSLVSLIAVAPSVRRSGVGLALLAWAAKECSTAKLFASTNRSNAAAQALLARAGFVPSGHIENLDPGDPELIYFRTVGEPHATGTQR